MESRTMPTNPNSGAFYGATATSMISALKEIYGDMGVILGLSQDRTDADNRKKAMRAEYESFPEHEHEYFDGACLHCFFTQAYIISLVMEKLKDYLPQEEQVSMTVGYYGNLVYNKNPLMSLLPGMQFPVGELQQEINDTAAEIYKNIAVMGECKIMITKEDK
jgi:hypothetical protein